MVGRSPPIQSARLIRVFLGVHETAHIDPIGLIGSFLIDIGLSYSLVRDPLILKTRANFLWE